MIIRRAHVLQSEETSDPPASSPGGEPKPPTDPPAPALEAPKIEVKAEPPAPPQPSPVPPAPKGPSLDDIAAEAKRTLDEIKARHERQMRKDTLAKIKRMGLNSEIIDDVMLEKILPQIDPDTTEGEAALVKFKEQHPKAFRRPEVGPQESLSNYKRRVEEDQSLTPRQRERRQRMANRLLGGE